MKKHILFVLSFAFMPNFLSCPPKQERQIRVSSVAQYFKDRIERLGRHKDRLIPTQCQVVTAAREWYKNLRNHHIDSKEQKKTATMPESVYRQTHEALKVLERGAHLKTHPEPDIKYFSSSKLQAFSSLFSIKPNYFNKFIEVTGLGVVAFVVYKIIHNSKPSIVTVNGENSEEIPPTENTDQTTPDLAQHSGEVLS